jgi:eukaryotic-like serine/threonine-protein kinase
MPTAPSPDLIPAAVRAAFEIIRPLGQGGMGAVWLARDTVLDRLVAIKVLLSPLADDATRDRFLREARTAARLSHPHIVPVHRAEVSDGQAWFSMGFVEGETLGDRIRDRGALPARDVVRLLRETAWALAYAHARGVIHRDVKPDNILIDRESGRAMVTDFGIARDVSSNDPRLTADGSVLGTVAYMSPEQATDATLDARSDVYALGCVGFHALSAKLPFDGTPNAILVAHVTTPAPALRSVAPDVPAPIAAVIDRCLAKDASARWEHAEALADALTRALDSVVTAERTATSAASGQSLSEREAMAVWQRAAQLQAEAAMRMERAMPAVVADETSPTSSQLRVRDVEAAAVEAGISRQYVAIALAEREASPADAVVALDDAADRRITRFLGTTQRSISVSRVIRASPKETLRLIGSVFPATPYSLRLRETVNGHPLDGGILRFDVPSLYKAMGDGTVPTGGGMTHTLIYLCALIDLEVLNVSLRQRGTAARPECEIIISGDLRDGERKNVKASIATMIGVGLGTGGGGLALGTALASSVAVAAAPALVVAGVTTWGTMVGMRAYFRRSLRRTEEGLSEMLATIQRLIDEAALFSSDRSTSPHKLSGDELMQKLLAHTPTVD